MTGNGEKEEIEIIPKEGQGKEPQKGSVIQKAEKT